MRHSGFAQLSKLSMVEEEALMASKVETDLVVDVEVVDVEE